MASTRKKASQYSPKKKTIQKDKFPENVLELQMLNDLEKRISLNVGSFLVLTEEGDPTQIALAHQKAKNEFMKFGPEMHKIAMRIGGEIPTVVADFLESIDIILHCSGFLDEDKIAHCYNSTQRLVTELKR